MFEFTGVRSLKIGIEFAWLGSSRWLVVTPDSLHAPPDDGGVGSSAIRQLCTRERSCRHSYCSTLGGSLHSLAADHSLAIVALSRTIDPETYNNLLDAPLRRYAEFASCTEFAAWHTRFFRWHNDLGIASPYGSVSGSCMGAMVTNCSSHAGTASKQGCTRCIAKCDSEKGRASGLM